MMNVQYAYYLTAMRSVHSPPVIYIKKKHKKTKSESNTPHNLLPMEYECDWT